MTNYPYILTWEQLAALPTAGACFDWDPDDPTSDYVDDETLAYHIHSYSSYLRHHPDGFAQKLTRYLVLIGLEVTETGVTVHNEAAVEHAACILNAIMIEYDYAAYDHRAAARLERDLAGYRADPAYQPPPDHDDRWPTWDLFDISGDDSVDYFGTQPTCLTALLLAYQKDTTP